MNNDFYSKESYLKDKKKAKKWLIFSICIFVFGLAFLGFSAFLIKPSTVLIIKIVDSIVVSICFIVSIYMFIELYFKIHSRNKFVYRLLTVIRFSGKIKILNIKDPCLVRKYVTAYEIDARDEENKEITIFYETIFPLNFKQGDVIEVVLADNFITEIREVSSHEK